MGKRSKLTQDEMDDLVAEVTALLNDGGTDSKEFWKAYIKRERRRRTAKPPPPGNETQSNQELAKQAVAWKDLASRARQLLRTTGGPDTTRIKALVAELEEWASALERGGSGQCQCL